MRINFFGGPGSSKSTTASRLFSQLKERGISVEQVSEYVKSWAYSNREPKEFDQIYLFAKQQHYEYRFLKEGVKNIVTDSPTLLSEFYADYYFQHNIRDGIAILNDSYEEKFPSLNIFLNRADKPFQQQGRFHSEKESREIDTAIYNFLKRKEVEFKSFVYSEHNEILKYVLQKIS